MVPQPPPTAPSPALPHPLREKIRIAVANGDDKKLDGLIAHEVPYQIVTPSADPDLLWDPASHDVSTDGKVVAYGVNVADLGNVIDRTAALRGLRKLAAAQPQPITLAIGGPIAHKGDKIAISIDAVAQRALILVGISGDGTVDLVYPNGSDPRIVKTSPFRLELEIHAPFGTDAIVAITADKPMDALQDGLTQISSYPSAIKVLDLVKAVAPKDAKIGVLTLTSVP